MNLDNELQDDQTADPADKQEEDASLVEADSASADEQSPDETEGTDETKQPEKVTFSPEQQAKVNEIADKKTALYRGEQRRAGELQAQLDDALSKIPVEARPKLPDLPEPFSDGYEKALAEREQIIIDQTKFDARQEEAVRQTQRNQQAQVQQQQQNLVTAVQSFNETAKEMGISDAEVQASAKAVTDRGINGNVAAHILLDPKGPAIMTFLAKNPMHSDKILEMTPMQASVYIENTVKPSLSSGTTTNAPPPPKTYEGGGSPSSERGPKGATFE